MCLSPSSFCFLKDFEDIRVIVDLIKLSVDYNESTECQQHSPITECKPVAVQTCPL